MDASKELLFLVLLFIMCISQCSCLHVQGEWNTSNFFKFLAKFGFQKTNLNDRINTQGYIFGNVTTLEANSTKYSNSSDSKYMLVVVDKEYFKNYYGNMSVPVRSRACKKMFSELSKIAFDSKCNPNGLEDFLRKVPCPKNGFCIDEDTPERVVSNYQFSYGVQDINQPRFWYVSLVACSQGLETSETDDSQEECSWEWNPENITIKYDIWLVNGNPYTKDMNPLEFQFSFHLIDTVEIYIVSFIFYTVLVCIAGVFVLKRQKHHLIKLYFTCLCLELISVILHLAHLLKFSIDGEDETVVKSVASVMTIIAQCIFVLLLLLIAKGWTITTAAVSNKLLLAIIWFVYVSVSLFLYVWNQYEVSVISDVDEYQTWPGYLVLAVRLLVMCCFLLELRHTFVRPDTSTTAPSISAPSAPSSAPTRDQLQFYLHFGAGFLVWFVYLPVVALVAAQVSALWRTKLILGISSAANLLYYTILLQLLWPTGGAGHTYFQLNAANYHTWGDTDLDDLEEFERERIRPRVELEKHT